MEKSTHSRLFYRHYAKFEIESEEFRCFTKARTLQQFFKENHDSFEKEEISCKAFILN